MLVESLEEEPSIVNFDKMDDLAVDFELDITAESGIDPWTDFSLFGLFFAKEAEYFLFEASEHRYKY